MNLSQSKFRRIIWLIVGCISFVLGSIGTVVPILPTFPFYLLCAFGFAKSSKKLHGWFIQTNLYKENFEEYVLQKGMKMKTKLKVLGMLTGVMFIGFIAMAMKSIVVGCILLLIVWFLHVIYFLWGVKTLVEE